MRCSATSTCLVQTVLSLFLFSSPVRSAAVARQATECNGYAELCGRSFGNITFVGAHDSYAVGTNNLATNQDYDVTQQLTDGVRMLQMQAHNYSGVIQLCHTSCVLYNGGTLATYLGKVKTWLDSNPNEVIAILIVNSDGFLPSDYAAVYESASMTSYSYSPPTATVAASQWPTLSSLISSGTRALTFMDAGANFTQVPYIIQEFGNIWETAYDLTDPNDFDCNVNRSSGDTSTQMFLINHFLDTVVLGQPAPDRSAANVTNAASGVGSLGQQVATCVADYGSNPNFMLVDFYEYGNGSVFEVAAAANGVTYTPSTPIATPLPDTTTTSTATASSAASFDALPRVHLVAVLCVIAGFALGSASAF